MNEAIIFAASYLYLVIVGLAIVLWFRLPVESKVRFALQLFTGLVLAFLLVYLLGQIWYDPRPFVVQGIAPLVPHAADNGFPSEHTTYSMLIAFTVWMFSWRWGSALGVLALVVGVGRIGAQVHSLPDILGGIAVAGCAALLAGFAAEAGRRLYRRRRPAPE